MKKCPVCEKTFDDSMRFCQTDGTPLDELVEETPEDPFKTMVARPEDDFAAAIPPPPSDPFKTMVAGSQPREDSGDLLQLPEEFDPMKTSVVSPDELREQLSADKPQEEPFSASAPPPSSSPFDEADFPLELNVEDSANSSDSTPPDIPRFNEPSLNPPDFGELSQQSDASENATEIIQSDSIPPGEPFSFEANPTPPEPSAPLDSFGDSPFGSPNEASIPSPFGDAPNNFEQPSNPIPPYKEPEPPTVLGANPFDQPPTYAQQQPVNQPFDQPAPQTDWTPPSAPPVSNWDQGLSANTPSQTPAIVSKGASQTLAIASIVCGAISLLGLIGLIIPFVNLFCGILSLGLAIAAIVTGFLARSRAKQKPEEYTGAGLALGGIITGGLTLLAMAGIILLAVIFVVGNRY
jgi:hypothetical protein